MHKCIPNAFLMHPKSIANVWIKQEILKINHLQKHRHLLFLGFHNFQFAIFFQKTRHNFSSFRLWKLVDFVCQLELYLTHQARHNLPQYHSLKYLNYIGNKGRRKEIKKYHIHRSHCKHYCIGHLEIHKQPQSHLCCTQLHLKWKNRFFSIMF